MSRLALAIVSAGLIMAGSSLWAQDEAVSLQPVKVVPKPVLASPQLQNVWPDSLLQLQSPTSPEQLTLAEVLGQTLTYHPELAMAIAKQQQAGAKLLESRGAFDVELSSGAFYNRYQTSSKLGTAQTTINALNKLAWQSRTGIQLEVGNKLVRDDVSSSFSPTGEAGETYAEVRLPLLRDLGINPAFAREQRAELNLTQAEAELLSKRLELLEKAGKAYWKWVASGQKLEVTQQLIELARFRLNLLTRQVALGDKAAIEATEAEQEFRRREALLARERSEFLQQAETLRLFLWDARQLSIIDQPLTEDTLPALNLTLPEASGDLRDLGKILGYKNRPELKVVNLGQAMTQVDWELARNQLLPRLDAVARPGVQLGADGIGPVLRAGVEFSVPLLRRSAKGKLQFAEFRLNELSEQERFLLGLIQTEVSQASIAIEQAMIQVQRTKEQVALAQQVAEGERRRFELGDSSLFLVNTRERQAANAEKDAIDAVQTLMEAWLRYWIVTAQL